MLKHFTAFLIEVIESLSDVIVWFPFFFFLHMSTTKDNRKTENTQSVNMELLNKRSFLLWKVAFFLKGDEAKCSGILKVDGSCEVHVSLLQCILDS